MIKATAAKTRPFQTLIWDSCVRYSFPAGAPPRLPSRRSPTRAITDCSSLSQDDKGLAEARAGDGEVHGADDRHDQHLGPDDIEAGSPVEDSLGEADEMRRGEDLHDVL